MWRISPSSPSSSHSYFHSHTLSTDQRFLVLLDDFALKSSHSIFFTSLQSRGFDLDFKLSDDPKLALERYGQHLYDGLILFSPTTQTIWRIIGREFFAGIGGLALERLLLGGHERSKW
ncbi:putative dolichyl-diphosphooligosaccharide--protein glycotransferase [Helianthus anomalus]